MKSDRGIISGFIGVAIHMTIQHILQHIYIANRCKKELADLKELVMSIELTILHIQQNRLAFKTEKDKEDASSAVNTWLDDLDDLLLQASEIVQQCSIPESRVNFSGCQPKKKILSLNKDIRKHLTLSPLLVRVPKDQVGDSQKVLEGLGQTKDRLEALASSATTSETARKNLMVSDSVLTALSEMGIADENSITIPSDSWELFKQHAFPYDTGNVPSNRDEENLAKLYEKCRGLPLAIKVVGRAMAGGTDLRLWEWALHSLPEATQDTTERMNACLRLSLDALGNQDFNLQLCFLYIAAAFSEDAIIDAQEVIPLLIGEGLLARKVLKRVPQRTVLADGPLIEPMIINTEGRPVCLRMQDPFELGRLYLDLLAERCLIEPTARDASGRVLCFRMVKDVHDWAIPIAKDEENFYHCEDLQNDGSEKNKRIFLSCYKLSSFPQFSPPSYLIRSLLISQSKDISKIPKKVFGSMLSLKVLDLSGTSAASLPENVGRLKQLRCLKLSSMPIKRLPKSLTALGYLEVLDVSFTGIEELPSNIHLLRSLRYLGLRGCKMLQNLPCNISGLLSLQYLYLDGCNKLTENPSSRCKKVASLHSLFDLIQLKKFALQINSEQSIGAGTLGSMTELDTLLLTLPKMESLPYDIYNLSNLRYLKFYECGSLKEIKHLHKLQNLRQLEIILCPEVRKFPQEFGGRGAFPALKIFSLVGLQNLGELPAIEEGAMPSLEVFNIMNCTLRLPKTYLNNSRVRIRVYRCPEVEVEVVAVAANTNLVQVESKSEPTKDIMTSTKESITNYRPELQKKDWFYGEFWCNEFFQEYCSQVNIENPS